MMGPVRIDVVTPIPTRWGLCSSCELMMERAGVSGPGFEHLIDDLPPEWRQKFMLTYNVTSAVGRRLGGRVQFRLIDPRSFPGFFIALRHGVREYPTFLIPGRPKFVATDEHTLIEALRAAGIVKKDGET
jgi:hypothetical protein